MTEANS